MTKVPVALDGRTSISARINATAVSILKNNEIPISDVVEAGILHFLSLDDHDKVAFLLKNNMDVADSNDFKVPLTAWPDCVRNALGLTETDDVKNEMKNFKLAAKWLPDKGAARLNQLSMRKMTVKEVTKKADELLRTGHLQDALSYYDYALMLAKKSGYPREIGALNNKIGDAYRNMGNFSLALAAYEGAETYFEKEKNTSDLANLSYSRGVCYQLWGQHKEAFSYFQQAIALFEQLHEWDNHEKTITRMSLSLDFLTRDEAMGICDQVIATFQKKKHYFTQLRKQQ